MENRVINKILIVESILIILLLIGLIILWNRPIPNDYSEEYYRSQERERILQEQVVALEDVVKSNEIREDSLFTQIKQSEKEREYYRKKYWYEKNRVATLPIDSGVVFLTNWLSEGDTL